MGFLSDFLHESGLAELVDELDGLKNDLIGSVTGVVDDAKSEINDVKDSLAGKSGDSDSE